MEMYIYIYIKYFLSNKILFYFTVLSWILFRGNYVNMQKTQNKKIENNFLKLDVQGFVWGNYVNMQGPKARKI